MIVSEVPGTTRDSVDSLLQWHKRTFRIVDTAGIRRPGQVAKSQVESVSVLLAKRAIERADVVVLVLDATVGPTDQDGAIAGAAKEAGRGIIIAANKWDLMKDQGPDASKVFDEKVRYHLKFLDYAPILHISAVTGERTPKLLEVVDRVAVAARTRVSTGELNRFIEKITTQSPPVTGGKSQRARDVCVAGECGAADVRAVYEHGGEAAFFVRAVSRKPVARDVRIFRQPDSHPGSRPQECATGPAHGHRARAGPAEAGEKRPGLKAHAGPRARRRARKKSGGRAHERLACEGRAARSEARRSAGSAENGPDSRYTGVQMAAPKRELFKAAEVCEVVQLQPYVLRSWEAEFPQIGQAPAGGGPRVYRRIDIELVLRIKQLVFDEGLTLSGARRRLEEDSGENNGATVLVDEMLGAGVREKLKTRQDRLAVDPADALERRGTGRIAAGAAPGPGGGKKKPVAKAKAKK